jgi:RNAse (barnase) inhibitor barstar
VGIIRIAMAVFDGDEVNDQQLDWTTLRDGGVALYWRPEVLAYDLTWLAAKGYKIVQFEAADWDSEEKMHDSFKVELSFPDYYGRNLNALNDCMWSDLSVPDVGGLVLVLNHYDQFAKAAQIEYEHFAKAIEIDHSDKRNAADIVLDVFVRASRYHMLFGKRLMTFVQSDDPRIRFDDLDRVSADWNSREWFKKNRGL